MRLTAPNRITSRGWFADALTKVCQAIKLQDAFFGEFFCSGLEP